MDESALFALSYGMFVLSTEADGIKNACIVNTVAQVTQDPIRVSLTILKKNYTTELISKSNKFSVSVLSKKASLDTVAHFGYSSGRNKDKFEGINYKIDGLSNPIVEKDCIATISCKVVQTIDLGTHLLFIADVVEANKLSKDEPMTYSYYRDLKAGKVSNQSNTQESKEPEKEEKPLYECVVCHYIYDGDIPFEDLPDDYLCPICHKPKSAFKRID